MRNRIPCQRDAGTRLATALRRRPFSACDKGNRRLLHAGKIVGVGSRRGRISQSDCTFPLFVIGLVLLLLLATPTIWFSLDHKRNVSDGVVSGIGTLFSPDHKLYASDYDSDSDSVASENQPLIANKRSDSIPKQSHNIVRRNSYRATRISSKCPILPLVRYQMY